MKRLILVLIIAFLSTSVVFAGIANTEDNEEILDDAKAQSESETEQEYQNSQNIIQLDIAPESAVRPRDAPDNTKISIVNSAPVSKTGDKNQPHDLTCTSRQLGSESGEGDANVIYFCGQKDGIPVKGITTCEGHWEIDPCGWEFYCDGYGGFNDWTTLEVGACTPTCENVDIKNYEKVDAGSKYTEGSEPAQVTICGIHNGEGEKSEGICESGGWWIDPCGWKSYCPTGWIYSVQKGGVNSCVPQCLNAAADNPELGNKDAVIYAATKKTDGNLGGRVGADNFCEANKPDGITCSNPHAFLSVNTQDQLKDMDDKYGYAGKIYWYNPNGQLTLMANQWDAMYGGTMTSSIEGLGTNDFFWTGSQSTGNYHYIDANYLEGSCDTWTYNGGTNGENIGMIGGGNRISWLHVGDSFCNEEQMLLCVCGGSGIQVESSNNVEPCRGTIPANSVAVIKSKNTITTTGKRWTYVSGKTQDELKECEWSCEDGYSGEGDTCYHNSILGDNKPELVDVGSENAEGVSAATVKICGLRKNSDGVEVPTEGVAVCRGAWWADPCGWNSKCSTGWEWSSDDFVENVCRADCDVEENDVSNKRSGVCTGTKPPVNGNLKGSYMYDKDSKYTKWTFVVGKTEDELEACEWTCDEGYVKFQYASTCYHKNTMTDFPEYMDIGSQNSQGRNNEVKFIGIENGVVKEGKGICRGDWWIDPCNWKSECSTGWEYDPADYKTVDREVVCS